MLWRVSPSNLTYLGRINLLKVLGDVDHPLCHRSLLQEPTTEATGDEVCEHGQSVRLLDGLQHWQTHVLQHS